MRGSKHPRDFVHVDELWEADAHWPGYYIDNKVWVFADEYRAELAGDEDYSRIVIHSHQDTGWLFIRSLEDKRTVERALQSIQRPVSELQLESIGFIRWKGSYI